MLSRYTPEEQDTLPIPLASLVIDVRTIKDNLLETLRLEIENLASEKQEREVIHWKHLADFTEFKALDPMDRREIDELWARMKADREPGKKPDDLGDSHNHRHMPQTGSTIRSRSRRPIKQYGQRENYPPYYEDDEGEQEGEPGDDGEQSLNEEYRECEELIDTVRNERINALSDLGTTGKRGTNTKDPRVHVIFITDARQPDSMASAAVYAAYLKQYYRGKLAHPDHDPVVISSILCLNHVNTTRPPNTLIQNLRWIDNAHPWEHISTLILAEKYREDAGRQDDIMQTYIAELLLYSLLIITIPDLEDMSFVPDTRGRYPEEKNKTRQTLPPNTYLFGLSAVEHSTRWGRRYLSTTLGLHTVEKLQSPLLGEERTRTKDVVNSWLSRWLSSLSQTIPGDIPPNFSAASAFDNANRVAQRGDSLFVSGDTGGNIGQRSKQRIEEYTSELAQTYSQESFTARSTVNQAPSANGGVPSVSSPTLQNALNNIDPVLRYIAQQGDEVDSPFVRALHEAQRVLSHSDFFLGAQGAIERAKMQLEELSLAISTIHKEVKLVDLTQRRGELENLSKRRLEDLQDHIDSFPFLRAVPWLIIPIVVVSLIILAFLGLVGAVASFAWLYRLALAIGGPSFVAPLNAAMLGIPLLNITNILLVVFVIVFLFLFFYLPLRLLTRSINQGKTSRRTTRNQGNTTTQSRASLQPTALTIEFLFIGLLIVAALFGVIVSLSLFNLATHTYSYSLLSWLSWLPFWSYLLAIVAVILALAELIHYLIWRTQLVEMRATIVEDLAMEQQRTVKTVQEYYVNRIALDILQRAELVDSQGNRGMYYERIDQLRTYLDSIAKEVEQQQLVARNRLTPRTEKATLQIRKELLDTSRLATFTTRIKHEIENEPIEVRELADVLLRVMGTESPKLIEQQLRNQTVEQSFLVQSYQDKNTLRHLQVLMTVATAVALRLATMPSQSDMIEPLAVRSDEIPYAADMRITSKETTHATDMHTPLKALIEHMRDNIKKVTIDVSDLDNGPEKVLSSDAIAIQALMMWTSVLWMHKDADLERILKPEDVTSVLLRTHDPKTVRDLLGLRLNPSGRSAMKWWLGDLYVLTPQTANGRKFIQLMDSRLRDAHIVASPDTERLIMLYLQHHVTPPHMIIQEIETPRISEPTMASNGATNAHHDAANMNNVVDGNIREVEQTTPTPAASNGHNVTPSVNGSASSTPSSTDEHTNDIANQKTVSFDPLIQSVQPMTPASAPPEPNTISFQPTTVLATEAESATPETSSVQEDGDIQGGASPTTPQA